MKTTDITFRIVSAALMSLALSSVMTFGITLNNLGWGADFVPRWGTSFAVAWPAATAIAFLAGPTVRSTSQKISEWLARHCLRRGRVKAGDNSLHRLMKLRAPGVLIATEN